MHALVAESSKKVAVVWVAPGGRPAYPLWCHPIDGALYVVTGGDEQPAPDLTGPPTVSVSARGDHGGLIVSWVAAVERIPPDADDWAMVAPALAAKRLNASGTVTALVETWATASTIFRLTPIDDEVQAPASDSGAAVARPTPAASRTAKPFRLHRVKRR